MVAGSVVEALLTIIVFDAVVSQKHKNYNLCILFDLKLRVIREKTTPTIVLLKFVYHYHYVDKKGILVLFSMLIISVIFKKT
jgi:hypothetical protein